MPTWEIRGNVQGVMFRQTFVRGLLKRGLAGGASNDPTNRQRVVVTIADDGKKSHELLAQIAAGDVLNSRGAAAESVELLEEFWDWHEHQVTTLNVEEFAWQSGVEFYL